MRGTIILRAHGASSGVHTSRDGENKTHETKLGPEEQQTQITRKKGVS